MRCDRTIRAAGFLLGVLLLAGGVWQCARDVTRGKPAQLSLELATAGDVSPGASSIDTVEIEVTRDGAVEARQKVALGGDGRFSAVLDLVTGGPYTVRVFGWGHGPAILPDSSVRGVLLVGSQGGIEIAPYQVTPAPVTLRSARTAGLHISGAPGEHTLDAWWRPVRQASDYTLGWYAPRAAAAGTAQAVTDTSVRITWEELATLGIEAGQPDSVLFRVRPHFAHRPGVFGESLWVDLALWLDPPLLEMIAPASGDSVGADTVTVHLRFDREVVASSVADGVTWWRLDDQMVVPFDLLPQGERAREFQLVPEAGVVTMGSDYRVTVTATVRDTLDRPFDGDPAAEGLQEFTADWKTAPYDPLRVTATTPAEGEGGVDRQPVVRLAFNRAVAAGSVTAEAVFLTGSDSALVAGTPQQIAPDSIRWTPSEQLWYDTRYTIHATPDLLDLGGYPLDQDASTYPEREAFAAEFTTLSQPVGPRVTMIVPDSGATAVSGDEVITVFFSEAVDPSTVRYYDTFRIVPVGGVGIGGSISVGEGDSVFTFKPTHALEQGTVYEVRVRGELPGGNSGVTDSEGVPLDQDRTLPGYQDFVAHFATEAPVQVAALGFTPDDGDSLVDVAARVEIAFSRPLEPASVAGTTVQLRRDGAELPAALSVTADSLVEIQPVDPLDHLVRYSVWVDTLVTAFDGSLLDQDLLTAGRQPFEFFFTSEPESLHPRVDWVLPVDDAQEVPVDDPMRLRFSLPIDPGSADAAVSLTRISGEGAPEEVPRLVTAAADSVVVQPLDSLLNLTVYELAVDTSLRSVTGFPLDQEPDSAGLQPFRSHFLTEQERIPPTLVSSYPEDGEIGVPVDLTIELIFSEPMLLESLPPAFHLLQGETELGGNGGLDESGMIWTFAPLQWLDWLETYTVVVDTTARDLAGNAFDRDPGTPTPDRLEIRFTTETDHQGPSVLWIEPDSAATGVAIDLPVRVGFSEPLAPASAGAGAFRVLASGSDELPGRVTLAAGDSVLTWQPVSLPDSLLALLEFGTSYTVIADTLLQDLWANGLDQDPLAPGRQPFTSFFTTMAETLAPHVTALLPGTEDVPVHAHPTVLFSEPMDSLSLRLPDAVRLKESNGPAVPFTLEFGEDVASVALVPDERLKYNTPYTLRVDTLATDLAGNRLDQDPLTAWAQPYVVGFRTEFDTEPPVVIAVLPPDSAAHVDPGTTVRITFSEAVDPFSVHSGSVYLVGPQGTIPLAEPPWLEEEGTIAVLQPADSLETGELFTVFATYLILDLADPPNNLDQDPYDPGEQDFSSVFSTGRGPVIVGADPICDWGDSVRVVLDATASYEEDPGDSIWAAVWNWGDGSVDSLVAPDHLIGIHEYAGQDLRGCNGLDDDGDGWSDESEGEGDSPCDESYRIQLRVYDTHGLYDTKVSGVSYCAFLVKESDPDPGDHILPGHPLRLTLSRAPDPGSVDSSVVLTLLADSSQVAMTVALEGEKELRLLPDEPLRGGTYLLQVTPGLLDAGGVRLDQDPLTEGRQEFILRFHVAQKPDDPPPADQPWQDGPPPPEGD